MTSLGRKIVGSVIWTATSSWLSQLITISVFVVLARYLKPEDFGLATLAMLPPIFFSTILSNGLPDALIQRPDIGRRHIDSAFWLLACAGVALGATVWVCAGEMAAALAQPSLKDLFRWTSVNIPIEALAIVPAAILKRDLGFRMLSMRTLIATAISAAVGISMAIGGFGVWSLVCLQITRSAVGAALVFAGAGWRPRLGYSQEHCRQLFGFACPVLIQQVMALANGEVPVVALAIFLGPEAVGIYAFSRRPFQILWDVFLTPLMSMVLPTLSRVQSDRERINRFFDTALRMIAISAFPVFVGFAAVAPVAVPFIFGSQWEKAVLVVQILTPLALLRTIDALCAYAVLALGHPKLVLKLNISFTVLATVPILTAARISVEALAATILFCNLAVLPFYLFFAWRTAHIDVRRPLAIFPRLALVSALMFGVVYAARLAAPDHAPQIAVLGCAIVLGVVTYILGAMGLIRPDLQNAHGLILKMRE